MEDKTPEEVWKERGISPKEHTNKMTNEEIKNIHCNCYDYVDKAVRIGRGKYACPICKKDISLLHFYYWCAVNDIDLSSKDTTE